MKETNKITYGIGVKLNKFSRLYHAVQGFLNMKQGEADPNDTVNMSFENIYETM